jgi:hypothetical protein
MTTSSPTGSITDSPVGSPSEASGGSTSDTPTASPVEGALPNLLLFHPAALKEAPNPLFKEQSRRQNPLLVHLAALMQAQSSSHLVGFFRVLCCFWLMRFERTGRE